MVRVLSELVESCSQRSSGQPGWNIRVQSYPILACPCCDVPDKIDVNGIRSGTSVKRPDIRHMNTLEKFQEVTCGEGQLLLDTINALRLHSKFITTVVSVVMSALRCLAFSKEREQVGVSQSFQYLHISLFWKDYTLT